MVMACQLVGLLALGLHVSAFLPEGGSPTPAVDGSTQVIIHWKAGVDDDDASRPSRIASLEALQTMAELYAQPSKVLMP